MEPNGILKMNKLLFLGYSTTLSVMMFFLTYVTAWAMLVTPSYYSATSPAKIVPEIVSMIPALLMLEAIPLTIFVTLFLTKGGGLNYFKTWNTGKKLRATGLLLMFGYIIVTVPALIDVLSGFTFRLVESGTVYNPLYMNPTCIGLTLMICALGAVVYLWKMHTKIITDKV
jgi:hypothetical protein